MDEWLALYREYSTQELADEIVYLKAQNRNPFASQTEGAKSYARMTAELGMKLRAAVIAMSERNQNQQSVHGIADFSQVQP